MGTEWSFEDLVTATLTGAQTHQSDEWALNWLFDVLRRHPTASLRLLANARDRLVATATEARTPASTEERDG